MSCKTCMNVVGSGKRHKGRRRRRVNVLGKAFSWDELMSAVASTFLS